jgi:hypothetical protein
MNPRGRPFEPGNKLGRGRPKGSHNKIKSAVLQLLEQSEGPVVAKIVRQAMDGHFGSQRLLMAAYSKLPGHRSTCKRVGKMQNVDDLVIASQQTMQQLSRGEITPEEAKTTWQGIEQTGQLLKQRSADPHSQKSPPPELPEFLKKGLEDARQDRIERQAKEEEEKLRRDGAEPP